MRFAKMQGAGNDFVVVEATGEEPGTGPSGRDWSRLAVAVCDRHFGIGADGLILALPSRRADVRMRMFNPDGSESEMCGNGIRCLAKYAVENGLARPRDGRIAIETIPGVLTADLFGDGKRIEGVEVSMGVPRFAAAEIPMALPAGRRVGEEERGPPARPRRYRRLKVSALTETAVKDFPLEVEGQRLLVTCLSLGNPHAVHFTTEPVEGFPLETIGPKVENHPAFPRRVNFEVARVLSRERMDLRVWERGAGATLACGSGACAAMVAARRHGLVGDKVDIRLAGGMLTVRWDGKGEAYLTGPAEWVFEGEWREGRIG